MILDHYIASTQRWITLLYALLFSGSFLLLLLLPRPIDDAVKTILISSTAALGSILMMQNTFWFGRPRGGGVPDAAVSTVTTTDPTGSSTVTKTQTPPPTEKTP